METLRQKLELVLATDPGVIEQYERRKEEVCSIAQFSPLVTRSSPPLPLLGIDQVFKQKDRGTRAAGGQSRKIDQGCEGKNVSSPRGSVRDLDFDLLVRQDNWHPALQDLVASIGKKFSEAFDRTLTASLTKALSIDTTQASGVRANCSSLHTTTMKNGQSQSSSSSVIPSSYNS